MCSTRSRPALRQCQVCGAQPHTHHARPMHTHILTALQVPCPSVFAEPSKALSVVIPAYNEEGRLPATLTETLAYLQRRRDRQGALFTYEVIVVDDGSRDGTVRWVVLGMSAFALV